MKTFKITKNKEDIIDSRVYTSKQSALCAIATLLNLDTSTDPREEAEQVQQMIDTKESCLRGYSVREAAGIDVVRLCAEKGVGRHIEDAEWSSLHRILEESGTLTLNDGRDGREYAYYFDGESCVALDTQTGHELSQEEIADLLDA